MLNKKELKDIKNIINELETLIFEYNDNGEYDYEDLKKQIYHFEEDLLLIIQNAFNRF